MNPVTRAFLAAFSFLVLPAMGGEEKDPRFFIPTNVREMNPLVKGASDGLLKAYGREAFSSTSLREIRRVGDTFLISFSFTLPNVKDPVTEKDFARINEGLDPFFSGQVDQYKKSGKKISSIHRSFPGPESAESYTPEKLPTMMYYISGEESDLFVMQVTFSDRVGGFMVAEFTIAAVK